MLFGQNMKVWWGCWEGGMGFGCLFTVFHSKQSQCRTGDPCPGNSLCQQRYSCLSTNIRTAQCGLKPMLISKLRKVILSSLPKAICKMCMECEFLNQWLIQLNTNIRTCQILLPAPSSATNSTNQ